MRVPLPSEVPAESTRNLSTATAFSSSVRNRAVSGPEGMNQKANTAMTTVIKPSKKKILRHVFILPQGGILLRPIARSPPKAPLALAADM